MADRRTILVTGATGQQGGAVAAELKGKGFDVRGMTRTPESAAAQALRAQGVTVVQGDLDDEESLKRALADVWGVFAVQNTWTAGVEGEEAQGKRVAAVARAAGVEHFVYTSVGSAHRQTGIPHFENKWRVEQTIRDLAFPSHVIVRPVFFMENILSPWFLNGDKIYSAMRPDLKLQMIAVADIGKHGARAFTDAAALAKREIDIAGDELSMTEVAATLSRTMGKTIEYVPIPIAEVRKNSGDFAAMLEWFESVGYDVDIAALARESGIAPTTFAEWAQQKAR
jgi:uncharacterized protein YbjT (DUF2867 family)